MEAEKKMHLTVRGKESVFRAGDISPGDRRPTCSQSYRRIDVELLFSNSASEFLDSFPRCVRLDTN